MLKLLLCSLVLYQLKIALAHVALTFPPARTYIFDYYDNARFSRRGPCGMAKTPGAPATTLITGSTITVTWHLSYPHEGGSKLELIRERGGGYDVVRELTRGFQFRNDTVKQSAVVTLPDVECLDCAIRLIRQGTEYYSRYAFWSCADVSLMNCDKVAISSPPTATLSPTAVWIRGILASLPAEHPLRQTFLRYAESEGISLVDPLPQGGTCEADEPGGCYEGYCMNGGTCDMRTGQCQCHRLFAGDRCQYKDECWTDEDCSYNGECINTRATTYPILKCYCERGWFGAACDRESQITEILDDYASNPNYLGRELLRNQVFMYWRYVNNFNEIEIIMRVQTHSWVGIGWKSSSITTRCKQLEPVLEVEEKHREAQTQLLQKQANYTTTQPSPARDPEIDVENRLGSNLEEKCKARSGREKRSVKRVRRQQRFPRVNRGMDCADITIGSVKGNLSRVQDMWTPDCSVPLPDAYFGGTDDITSAYGTQENGFTTIAFRKRLSVNHFSDHSASDGQQTVIWARGQDVNSYAHSPPTGLDDCKASDLRFYRHDELKYHGGNYLRTQKGRFTHTFNRPTPPPPTTTTVNGNAGSSSSSATSSTCNDVGEFRTPSGCFSADDRFNCYFYVSWELNDEDEIVFTMKGRVNNNSPYLALGISDKQEMPNTDIYYAYLSGGTPTVVDSYARSRSTPNSNEVQNVNVISGSFVNRLMTVTFSRPRLTTGNVDVSFDECRFLLFAKGFASGPRVRYHGGLDSVRGSSPNRICIEPCRSTVPPSPAIPSTSSTAATPSVSPSASRCSTSFGEWRIPSTCNLTESGFNCDFYASWQLESNDMISFTMKTAQANANTYIALGISDDRLMARSDIYAGYLNRNGQAIVSDRYASRRGLPPADNEQDLSDISGNLVNGVLTIEFSRPLISSSPFDIGFSQPRFLLYARGSVSNGVILYHRGSRSSSENRITIEACPIVPSSISVTSPTPASCSTSFGEFKVPNECNSEDASFNCDFYLSWELDNGGITFTMKSLLSGSETTANTYIALGVSNNTQMAMSDMYVGTLDSNGQAMVSDRYATSRSTPAIDGEQNVNSVTGSSNNNVLTIAFSRPRLSSDADDLSLNECRFLLYAKGPRFSGNAIGYHGNNRGVTTARICIEPCNSTK